MDYLPLHFDLKARCCLVVGGGSVAYRKALLLDRAGAHLRIVARRISPELRQLLKGSEHELHERAYQDDDLTDVFVVVCATNDPDVNELIFAAASSRQIPVNVVDRPDLCTVIFPAIVDRSPVIMSVGTGGRSPVLTGRLRNMLESLMTEGAGKIATYLGDRREKLKQTFTDIEVRRHRTNEFLDSPGVDLVERGHDQAADEMLFRNEDVKPVGEVYLVGAGPGDPDLLTLKALQLMQRADIVLYDSLVDERILERVRRDARKLYVGKQGGGPSTSQQEINELLVELGAAGEKVLRLKGGDPFIFGRGGEEIESLVDAGIPFQVIPGITAATGCAAYAGIPLTHRDYSQSVRFVTGHPRQGQVDLEWSEISHRNQTVVFYMGLGGLAEICQQMMNHGRAADTPVAVIARGTTPDQQVLIGDLQNISTVVAQNHVTRPTLTIVGEVVALYERFNRN